MVKPQGGKRRGRYSRSIETRREVLCRLAEHYYALDQRSPAATALLQTAQNRALDDTKLQGRERTAKQQQAAARNKFLTAPTKWRVILEDAQRVKHPRFFVLPDGQTDICQLCGHRRHVHETKQDLHSENRCNDCAPAAGQHKFESRRKGRYPYSTLDEANRDGWVTKEHIERPGDIPYTLCGDKGRAQFLRSDPLVERATLRYKGRKLSAKGPLLYSTTLYRLSPTPWAWEEAFSIITPSEEHRRRFIRSFYFATVTNHRLRNLLWRLLTLADGLRAAEYQGVFSIDRAREVTGLATHIQEDLRQFLTEVANSPEGQQLIEIENSEKSNLRVKNKKPRFKRNRQAPAAEEKTRIAPLFPTVFRGQNGVLEGV